MACKTSLQQLTYKDVDDFHVTISLTKSRYPNQDLVQELDIGSVDKVLDEINEQADQMAQIQDAMSQPMGGAAAIDDDDLLAELEVIIFH